MSSEKSPQKLVVGVDGSEHSQKVLQWVADFAAGKSAEITLVYAITPHALSEEELAYAQQRCGEKFSERLLGSGLPPYPIEEDSKDRSIYQYIDAREVFNHVYGEDILDRAKTFLEEKGLKNIKTEIEDSSPAEAILEVARRMDADMIIIGRRSHNRLVEFLLGSTAQKVLQQTDRTVITIE